MAKYRNVHIDFWQDGFVLDLTPEEKYFYLYLMTNSKTTQCGIYELPTRIIETETGYNRETVDKLIKRFIDYKKIQYNSSTREVMLLNWSKYNYINSPKVKILIDKELKSVKHKGFVELYCTLLKGYGYHIDTVGIDLGEERELRKRTEKEKDTIVEIINYLNQVAIKNYQISTKKTKSLISARMNEGFSVSDFKKVIDVKSSEWKDNPTMDKYLRPTTLFGTNFESYLNEKIKLKGGQGGNAPNQPSYEGYDFEKQGHNGF